MKSKLKVLIICYDYPPLNSIGAFRPYSWAKYLSESNIFPIVVTRLWEDGTGDLKSRAKYSKDNKALIEETESSLTIRVPHRFNLRDYIINQFGLNKFVLLRRMLTASEMLFKWFCRYLDNSYYIFEEANRYLKNNKIDLILATGEPWINFYYASNLSKKYGIPWIPDYRDGWSTNTLRMNSRGLNRILNECFYSKLERRILSSTNHIMASDPCELQKLKRLFPEHNFHLVYNGFDEDLIHEYSGIKQNCDQFNVSYAGTIYPFQDLETFLSGITKFVNEFPNPKLRINFIGAEFYTEQIDRIFQSDASIHQYIETSPRISQGEVIKLLAASHLLLILSHPSHVALPAKIFEYFGLDRKILVSINDKSDIESLMNECSGGYLCDSEEDVYRAIKESYLEFIKTGKVVSGIENKEQYSRRYQTENLAKIIYKIV